MKDKLNFSFFLFFKKKMLNGSTRNKGEQRKRIIGGFLKMYSMRRD